MKNKENKEYSVMAAGMSFLGMMIILIYLAIMGNKAEAQTLDGQPMSQMGIELLDMQRDIAIGNACGVADNYFITTVPGNMNMNGHELAVLDAHITIEGEIINEGTIYFLCDSAYIEFAQTLDDDKVPELVLNEVRIYPNPATDYVHVNGVGIKKIQVYDLKGGLVVKEYTTVSEKNVIAIHNLAAGYYLFLIEGSNGAKSTYKLIKR